MDQLHKYFERCGFSPLDLGCKIEGEWPISGTISPDKTAVVCSENWIDMYGGSNNYYDFYKRADEESFNLALRWSSFLDETRDSLNEKQIRFAACIVPNKASVLYDHYPFELSRNVTPALNHLMAIQGKKLLCPLQSFRSKDISESIFRRNDSHLAQGGRFGLVMEILNKLGYDQTVLPAFERKWLISNIGDLGNKFDPHLSEKYCGISLDVPAVKVNVVNTPKAGVLGLHYTTECADAPIDQSIVVFGNSYFDRVPGWAASPIMARVFKRMTFVWFDKIDYNIVSDASADIVVYQNVERFLRRAPT